jgi:hypothetical protein
MKEAPIHSGEDRHCDYEQYNREDHDVVPPGQDGAVFMGYQLPDMLVPTITILEGVAVNISI